MSTKCGCFRPSSYIFCAGFKPNFTSLEGTQGEWGQHYAATVGAPQGKDSATTCSPFSFVADVIIARRLPYYKDTPGDCAKDTKVNISGAGLSKGLNIGGSVGGTVSTLGSFGALGITGVVSTIATIATFGAGLLLIPLAFIGHHSAEVALEQQVLCAVSSGYNDYADQVETMLAAGQISLQQANIMADQMQDQIVKALAAGLNQCNGRCYYTYAIKALTLFCKERLYPFIYGQAQAAKQPQLSSVPVSSTAKTVGVGIGLAALVLIAKAITR